MDQEKWMRSYLIIYLKISNGVVASDYTKHIYFSDAVIGATTIPSQTYIEDVADNDIDFNITTSNVSPDANTFTATVTLAAPTNGTLATSSSFNASVYGIAFIESFNASPGVLTTGPKFWGTDQPLAVLNAEYRSHPPKPPDLLDAK